MSRRLFDDRREAGRALAGLLFAYRDRDDVIVLGLARGGVPVAFEVADALRARLDVASVRKLGVPGHEELAFGASAAGGRQVLDEDVMRTADVTPEQVGRVVERESAELRRREARYRGTRPAIEMAGQTVIVVDDGLATGSTMRAAVLALRESRPAEIVVAIPVAPESACRQMTEIADRVVCVATPEPFFAVGASYRDFEQTDDEQVRDLLARAGAAPPGELRRGKGRGARFPY
ncbi:hypothetical protein GOARA_065_00160 [Gordonia araii NBRC 100433]|uniref:Phosphoribosyltransferase domain-containing protein n=1 Tax=Gordonia araii NBRC 100433 TaxID=1073574 RepID=G7H5U8_9ACTN|nr:phosphoribosyltransferase [Gordonia araii NBRC 100433]GAB11223.1 hypothetical protein GOARA_065_00160 [Gordonia araii NBRC 100433]